MEAVVSTQSTGILMRLIVFLFAIVSTGLSTRLKGSLVVDENWHYIGKFCFSNSRFDGKDPLGTFQWRIQTSNKNLSLVFYLGDVDDGSWAAAYKIYQSGNWSCQQLVDMRHISPNVTDGTMHVISNETDTIFTLDVVRPYWWYVALADCGAQKLDVPSYDLHFLNPAPGSILGIWYLEFSYDIQGLAQAYIVFTVLYCILGVVHCYGVRQLMKNNEYHPIIKLLTLGINLLFLSCFFYTCHFSFLSYNGYGVPVLEGFAMALTMLAQLLLMFICILVSKGWTISTPYLSQANLIKLFLVVITGCYVGLIIWDFVLRDPASTLYFYDSPIGIIIVLFRVTLAGWFVWNIFNVLKVEIVPEKRKFYINFALLFSCWFVLLPLMVVIALALRPWYRERTVSGISLAIDAFGFIGLVYLLWPSRVNQYFTVSVPSRSFVPGVDHVDDMHENL
eukprot:TRINITY_DN15778_c0_g1_i5.p1 TRINITY_DN15778_c0_g1~~TRINITY_DN15778_c0_g1_i5.p1  ORF type:complete len:449 (-),score=50.30 TRINITY_DN15778_c0_g1_i5:106-1452(-)